MIILFYDGKKIGEIITNQSLTLDSVLELLNIDPTEMGDGGNEPLWDYEKFSMRNQ